jgi:hypothetical protein
VATKVTIAKESFCVVQPVFLFQSVENPCPRTPSLHATVRPTMDGALGT